MCCLSMYICSSSQSVQSNPISYRSQPITFSENNKLSSDKVLVGFEDFFRNEWNHNWNSKAGEDNRPN